MSIFHTADEKTIALADFIVCRPASWKFSAKAQKEWFDILVTNEHGRCADCGRAIMFRPAAGRIKIKKVCILCHLLFMEKQGDTKNSFYRMFRQQALAAGEKL